MTGASQVEPNAPNATFEISFQIPKSFGAIYFRLVVADVKGKGKAAPLQASIGPQCSRKLRLPDFLTTAQDGGRLSALRTGRLYPQEMLLVLISVRG